MLKKLIAASTILGAAVLLSNKARRDQLAETARRLLKNARDRAQSVADKTLVEPKPIEQSAHTPAPKWVRPGGY